MDNKKYNNETFLEALETNGQNVLSFKPTLKKMDEIGVDISFLDNASKEDIESVILKLHPSSINVMSNTITMFNIYRRLVDSVPFHFRRKELWNRIQKKCGVKTKKFLSEKEYTDLLLMIDNTGDNSLWYSTLIQSVWEGIWNNDLSVIKNLRASDVNGNTVMVRPDNEDPYELKVSDELAKKLIKLSTVYYWQRNVTNIQMDGDSIDTCFKYERRNKEKTSSNYRSTYTQRFRKISEKYLDFSLQAKNLYISGLVCRVVKMAENAKMKINNPLDYIFSIKDNKRDTLYPFITQIIESEFSRSHCPISIHDFRKYVSGNLADFK